MIATVDDVVAGVKALWSAAGAPGLVTGLHDWRQIPTTAAPPCAIVKVVPSEKMTNTANYLEKFNVSLWIHSVNGTHDRVAMQRLADRMNWSQSKWPVGKGICLHVKPIQATTDASPFTNQARDVAISPMTWEVLMQQNR